MSNNKRLSIKGTLSLEDFIKYNKYHLNKTVTIYFIICFFILFAIIQGPLSGDLFFIIIFAGIPSLIISSLLFLFAKTVNKQRAIKEFNSDQLIKKETMYSFSSEGIEQKIRRSSNYFEWDDFLFAIEREEIFLLYVSKHKAIVLPKSFFSSTNEIVLFKGIVSTNMEASKVRFN